MNESQEQVITCENCYHGRPFGQEKWEGEPQPIEYECDIMEVPPDFGKSCPKWEPKQNIEKHEQKQ